MALVLCSDPRLRVHFDTLEPPPTVTGEWDSFERNAMDAAKLVVCAESLLDWPYLDPMRKLRVRTPGVPWILVTGTGERNLLELGRIEVEEVVPTTAPERISAAIRNARVRGVRSGFVRLVNDHEGFSHHEKRLLRALFEAGRPPKSCRGWGRLVHIESATVKYHLSRVKSRGGPAASLVINANLMLAGLEIAPDVRSWRELSTIVDVDDRRLRRTAAQLAAGTDRRRGDGPPRVRPVARGLAEALERTA